MYCGKYTLISARVIALVIDQDVNSIKRISG
jgi:hypothetical protein